MHSVTIYVHSLLKICSQAKHKHKMRLVAHGMSPRLRKDLAYDIAWTDACCPIGFVRAQAAFATSDKAFKLLFNNTSCLLSGPCHVSGCTLPCSTRNSRRLWSSRDQNVLIATVIGVCPASILRAGTMEKEQFHRGETQMRSSVICYISTIVHIMLYACFMLYRMFQFHNLISQD